MVDTRHAQQIESERDFLLSENLQYRDALAHLWNWMTITQREAFSKDYPISAVIAKKAHDIER